MSGDITHGGQVTDTRPGDPKALSVDVAPARVDEAPILANLVQLYLYDFTELGGPPMGDDGRFDYGGLDDYWRQEGRFPFLIRVDGALAGFVLVAARRLFEEGDDGHELTELFVTRRYRRRGVGRSAAAQVLRRFPGPWYVGMLATNAPAVQFWRKVIGELTNGRYEEEEHEVGGRLALVQRFEIGSPAA